VRGVSFDLERGDSLGLVGESGSGKSVGTQAIPALLPGNALVSGSIRYEGEELLGAAPQVLREYRGKKIGMIFQEPGRSYDPLQNMGSVFFETLRNSFPGISREESDARAAALLRETGLENSRERLSNFPHQFSGGQLQRIGIALALAQNCELLIADEPTTALDVTIQAQILELMKKIKEKTYMGIIFITHNMGVIAEICDTVAVMYGGYMVEQGTVEDIFYVPLHPYTKGLLRSMPRIDKEKSERLIPIEGTPINMLDPNPGCPFAPRCGSCMKICVNSMPPETIFAENHRSRCWLHIRDGSAQEGGIEGREENGYEYG
jgi:oligopeptide/dipeptide ABC transporter ATP-binding protein